MSFFRREIHMLPGRWEKVVSRDGQYFNRSVFVLYILNKVLFCKKQRGPIQGPITIATFTDETAFLAVGDDSVEISNQM